MQRQMTLFVALGKRVASLFLNFGLSKPRWTATMGDGETQGVPEEG